MDNQFLNFGNPPISMGGYFFINFNTDERRKRQLALKKKERKAIKKINDDIYPFRNYLYRDNHYNSNWSK